ncbi:MAG TPA: hypothetical protein VG269_08660 [Tepidisphaeraceae bacterium]|jgi:hypothetical protein|nr:hypothetical protein [Tepidisphaeraceae bacterium]
MVTNTCPVCGQPIAANDINVQQGVGLCRSCGNLSPLNEIVNQQAVDPKALAKPPAGCSYEERLGGGLVVRASARSVGGALGTLAVCIFWNGITSVFLVFLIGGLYTHFIGPVPKWFPAPSSNSKPGSMNYGDPLGTWLFLGLFLTPFVLIGLGMFLAFLMCVFGRVEVRVTETVGRVRTGFGPLNWTRRFNASTVKRVIAGRTTYSQNGQTKPLIRIEAGDRTVKFGSTLPDERRDWMCGVLYVLLVTKNKTSRTALGLSQFARG